MEYRDANLRAYSRPARILATNADGTVNIQITEPSGEQHLIDDVLLVPAGGTPPENGFYAQAAKTAAEVQAEQQAASNEAAIRQALLTDLETHRGFLAIAGAPSNAQILAEIRALARTEIRNTRLALRRLDGVG